MKKVFCIFFVLFNIFGYSQEIRIRNKQSNDEANYDYCIELLEKALKITEKEYGKAKVKKLDIQITQGRSFEEIKKGKLVDIDFAATSIERENELLAIKVPLFKGLLGYRVPVIKKDNIKKFDKIKTIQDLKKISIIQGTHWPDTEILLNSKFNVMQVAKFENMYPLLENGRGDAFFRSVCEAYGEVALRANEELVVYDKIIIAYKMPMYFFVNKNNKKLAERIEKGLLLLIENGEFLNFMKNHPITKPVFSLEKYKNSLIFELPNPTLPEKTPVNDSKLWIKF